MRIIALLILLAAGSVASAQCPNTALQFDGVDDIATAPHTGAIDGLIDFTVEFWVRATGQSIIFSKPDSMNSNIQIYSGRLETGSTSEWVRVALDTTPTGNVTTSFAGPPGTFNTWQHIAFVRAGGLLYGYRNGVGGQVSGGNTLPVSFGATDLTFGAATSGVLAPGGPGSFGAFNGGLDEFRIWNIARNQLQIQAGMNAPLAGNELGLVAYYDFDSGSGQTILDRSPTANNGVLGSTSAIEATDPLWSALAPTLGCIPPGTGMGGANSADARLEVNGIATGATPGPFVSPITQGQSFAFDFYGDPNQPYILFGSPILNPGNTVIPGFGSVDIGTPPLFSDIFAIFDGTTPPGSLFYQLDSMGEAHLSFVTPLNFPAGPVFSIQAAMVQAPPLSGGFAYVLSAAHTLVVQ